jgi:hypothetical protein
MDAHAYLGRGWYTNPTRWAHGAFMQIGELKTTSIGHLTRRVIQGMKPELFKIAK